MSNKKYSKEDKQFIAEHSGSMSLDDLAIRFCVNKKTLSVLCCMWRKEGYNIAFWAKKRVEAREGYKYCPRCKDEKLKKFFCKKTRSNDGLHTYCRSCLYHIQSIDRKKNCYKKKENAVAGDCSTKNAGIRRKLHDGSTNNKGEYEKYIKKQVFHEHKKLDDDSLMPVGYYKDCKMIDVPAWHLLKLYNSEKCDIYVRAYVEENIEILKMQLRK